MVLALLMVFAVNILLLFSSGRLLGRRLNGLRVVIGACAGTLYAAWSILSEISGFKGYFLWICSLMLTGLLGYGIGRRAFSEILLFCLLQLSLTGISGHKPLLSALTGAMGIWLACIAAGNHRQIVPVQLRYGQKKVCLQALEDTGNSLHDPITGKAVLVVGSDIAQQLTGLSPAALENPVEAIGMLPGLRLIPYKTVGKTGFLLALYLTDAIIGDWKGSTLVAFSPNPLGQRYQALTGGMV